MILSQRTYRGGAWLPDATTPAEGDVACASGPSTSPPGGSRSAPYLRALSGFPRWYCAGHAGRRCRRRPNPPAPPVCSSQAGPQGRSTARVSHMPILRTTTRRKWERHFTPSRTFHVKHYRDGANGEELATLKRDLVPSRSTHLHRDRIPAQEMLVTVRHG